MATNTSALKTFAQETRKKLISLIRTKMDYILTQDTAQLRGFESQIAKLKSEIASKGKDLVVEEVAYTWFNRVMALRYMDANGYTDLRVVTLGIGMMRPEILQEAMSGNIDEDLHVNVSDNPKEAVLYRRLLVAVCNHYGTSMPFLFEHISDYTEMLLPDDLLSDQSFVTDIRNGMSDEDCQNVEVMGWLYQFYITDRKADAEVKKTKKGGLKSDEQAAATQLFTPHWVVRYMVENSLGRIWMTLHPESSLIKEMPYYIPTPEGQTDVIPEDIQSAADIRFIDPCMGSGHILVYAFDLFCKMYEEEGVYQEKEIPQLILTNNLFGIDIDRRCYQLAAFALTMKARAYYRRYLRKTVTPNVIALQTIDRDTIESAGAWNNKSSMWQFENIDTIGSLLQITPEECASITIESGLFGERQQLLKAQAEYLSRKYHCVVTNPPYLGKGFGNALKNYIVAHYPNSKADTMATFMERTLDFCMPNGKMAMINMQSWMFLSSYEKLREHLLATYNIDSLLHLGAHAFDEIGGEVVQSATFVISNQKPSDNGGIYYRLVEGGNSSAKENAFLKRENEFYGIRATYFDSIPGKPVCYWVSATIRAAYVNSLLSNYAIFKRGIGTGDNNRFLRYWHEISQSKAITKWAKYNKGGSFRKWYGNRDYVVDWENDGYGIKNNYTPDGILSSRPQNLQYNFKKNISYSSLTSGKLSFRCYEEHINDQAGNYFIVNDDCKYNLLIALLNSAVADYFKSIKTTL